ncbi:hypothetical protein Gotur_004603 [Gossypium turneri]
MVINENVPSVFAAEVLACIQSIQKGLRLVNGVAHLLFVEGLKTGEQWSLRDDVPKFARGAMERDRRGLIF